MSTPVLTVLSFIEDVKLEMRIPVADTTEDSLIFSLMVELAAGLFRKHINDYDWLTVLPPDYVDSSTAKIDTYLIDSIQRVEIYHSAGAGYIAIPHITQPTSPMDNGKPTHYSHQLALSTAAPSSSWVTTINFYPPATFASGLARVYFKGIKLPATIGVNSKLEFPFLYPELKKAILQRLQIKRGDADMAQLLQPTGTPSK